MLHASRRARASPASQSPRGMSGRAGPHLLSRALAGGRSWAVFCRRASRVLARRIGGIASGLFSGAAGSKEVKSSNAGSGSWTSGSSSRDPAPGPGSAAPEVPEQLFPLCPSAFCNARRRNGNRNSTHLRQGSVSLHSRLTMVSTGCKLSSLFSNYRMNIRLDPLMPAMLKLLIIHNRPTSSACLRRSPE